MRLPAFLIILSASLLTSLQIGSGARAGDTPDAPAYKLEAGPFKVQTIKALILEDAKRKKVLQLRITYPNDGESFPLIVFSHGLGATKDHYQPVITLSASHGDVCIQPDHSDSRAFGGKHGPEVVGNPVVFKDRASRPLDISFILDSLDDIETKVPSLKGKVDLAKIGVAGHSYGAFITQLLAGAAAMTPDGVRSQSFHGKRIGSVIVISGMGTGEIFTKQTVESVHEPMLMLTGTKDRTGCRGLSAPWVKEVYDYTPPGDKQFVGGVSQMFLVRAAQSPRGSSTLSEVCYSIGPKGARPI